MIISRGTWAKYGRAPPRRRHCGHLIAPAPLKNAPDGGLRFRSCSGHGKLNHAQRFDHSKAVTDRRALPLRPDYAGERRRAGGDGPSADLHLRLCKALALRARRPGNLATPHRLVHLQSRPAWHYFLLGDRARRQGRLSVAARLVIATLVEASWEIVENTPFIINRYRTATIARDYFGDSIINSTADTATMIIGFLVAARLPAWVTVALLIGVEVALLVLIRDNLTLNIIMLIHPFDWIKAWQAAG